MKFQKMFLVLCLFLMMVNFVYAKESSDQLLIKANEAYLKNDFDSALKYFSELEQDNTKSPDLYYNIGNSYFRLNRIGLAVLYYKKALLNNSSHSLAKKNLNFALKFTIDKQDYENQNYISNLIISAYNALSLNTLAVVLLVSLCFFVFILQKMIKKNSRHTHTLQLLFVISIFISCLFIVWSSMRYYHFVNNNEAVVLSSEVNAYSGPGENFSKLFSIHEGLIIKVNKKENAWTLISLSNGFSGWIRSSTYKVIIND